MTGKLLCIGLDGATYQILDPVAERGWMPHLKGMMERGARGVLRSTIPALSGPAWVTFMTGKSPGRHGVYDFGVRRSGYLHRMFQTRLLEDLTVWELIDRAGGESVVVNVPMTYPPHRIRGAVVTGLMTPGTESDYTHPKELKAEILRRWPGYQIDVQLVGNTHGPFLDAHIENNRKLGELSLDLLKRYNWNYAMICFVATDRIQHLLHRELLRLDLAAPEIVAKLENYYRLVDGFIGQMLEVAGETNVLLMSDHGFTACRGTLQANEWLAQQGFLVKSKRAGRGATGGIVRWARKLGINNQNLQRMAHRIGLKGISLARIARFSPFVHAVDWEKTRVFYANTDGFSINLAGREPQGIVQPGSEYEALRDELIGKLRSIRHLDGAAPLFRSVWRREEIYDGPFVQYAPDVLVDPDGVRVAGEVHPGGASPVPYLVPPDVWTGVHHPDGVLIAHGPDIRPGRLNAEADLRDVAPTTLSALGLPVPEDMDGRVIEELFREDVRKSRPTRRSGSGQRGDDSAGGASDEDQAKLEEQLRSLGYL